MRADREDWPFVHSPPQTETLSTRQVVHENRWIAFVSHDEDGTWQLIHRLADDEGLDSADAVFISLGKAFEIDPSLAVVADLPPGWSAERPAPDGAWRRCQTPAEPD